MQITRITPATTHTRTHTRMNTGMYSTHKKTIKPIHTLLFFLTCCASNHVIYARGTSSQTFLFTRPGQQNIALNQEAGWHNTILDKSKSIAFQVTGFFQRSRNTHTIQHFFLPLDHSSVVISSTAPNLDVLPAYLGLPTNFSGVLSIRPYQRTSGFIVEARKNLDNLFPESAIPLFKNTWIQLALPIIFMHNNLHLTQTNVLNPAASSNTVYDILSAFNNPDWNYLKIHSSQEKRGIAEARFTLGTRFLSNGRFQAATYTTVSIPTIKRVPNYYMFEAQPGNNGHWAYIWGINLQTPLSREEELPRYSFVLNIESTWLLKRHQSRTFDLINKQWSRYLPMRLKNQTTNTTTPGVNVLTHRVLVKPRCTVDFATGLRAHYKSIEAEFGYGLWAFGGESVYIRDTAPWVANYGIAGTATNTTASASTISYLAPDDATFTTIKETDLDLLSGSMPATLVHKIHGSVGCSILGEKTDGNFGVGAFIEFPNSPTKALATWGLWAKLGCGF